MISKSRNKKSQGYYKQIGGGSPLRKITEDQAEALRKNLEIKGLKIRTYIGMRYWHPLTEEAFERIIQDRIDRLVVLPLYPQFSTTTTGSGMKCLESLIQRSAGAAPEFRLIEKWHDDPAYIISLAATIEEQFDQFPENSPSRIHIIFSAHSIPESYIRKGDPYLEQIWQTVRLVMERLGVNRPHSLSFQSKLGPVRWLQPSTEATIRKLANEGTNQMLVVPVSFVSDHVETLYELDILYRGIAEEMGVKYYRRVPALNIREDFIEVLAGLVQKALK